MCISGTAQMKLAAAEAAKITAQNTGAGTILLWQQRAMDANDDAAGYATAARAAANKADAQADTAEADAARAMRARTDYANANKKAMAARTAANAAETAAKAAEGAAKTASDAVAMATADDATVAVAREQSNIARAAAIGASGEPAKANTGYMDAMEAAGEAKMYAGRHVIGLLSHANGQDILDVDEDVATAPALRKLREARIKAVSDQINMAAGDHTAVATDVGDRDQDSTTTDTTASEATATASWLGRNLDVPTSDADESTMPSLSITVSVNGTTDLVFRTEAAEEDDDDTNEVDETIVTATALDPGLGSFVGYSISDRGNHAIVFTDKKQGADQVFEVEAVTGRQVENEAVTAAAELALGGDKTGPTFTGVTWTPSGEEPLMGTLNCADAANCDIQIDAAGAITVIEGYTFTGSRDAVAEVEAAVAMENPDYLAFGVWLQEDSNGDTEGTPKAFAAFANGGEPIDSFATYVTLTGTANYSGDAAGVYTQGDSVDWFEGDASLTANFGAPGTDEDADADDDEIGTISGMINNIMAGGVATGDVISLRRANIVNDQTAFSGNARMGTGVDENDDDVLEYPYNGTWSGNFFGAVAAVEDNEATTDVDEEMAAAAPEAVAGTFGVSGTMGEGDDAVTSTYVGAFGARKVD